MDPWGFLWSCCAHCAVDSTYCGMVSHKRGSLLDSVNSQLDRTQNPEELGPSAYGEYLVYVNWCRKTVFIVDETSLWVRKPGPDEWRKSWVLTVLTAHFWWLCHATSYCKLLVPRRLPPWWTIPWRLSWSKSFLISQPTSWPPGSNHLSAPSSAMLPEPHTWECCRCIYPSGLGSTPLQSNWLWFSVAVCCKEKCLSLRGEA